MRAIYNFRQVSDMLACAGQPTEEQLQDIAHAGYSVIINLGLADGKYALANEAASVKKLGLAYHHIPVAFNNPQADDLHTFIGLMNNYDGRKTLVHCAANYRASAFTGLYLLASGRLDSGAMQQFIEKVWHPDNVWQQFIDNASGKLGN
jgi:protein tyrosine phosphatase (PTP) superfamily phosphohydrolase (DUF442 family)